ncbi:bifunctional N(6)-L-threonylcarbamoyladenine synthase/serine/threonine protein kinase [Candidatus Woesearchaeota archaeon]|nr:bifunctional N(6)-L-threonylcarbamoyladenine synthase/serine/threonine protein kinase [Candidatus Woesearchaeota archaeon]
MIVLGIESTAHTFGVGIIEDRNVLANVKDAYTTESGGIIPSAAADHHVNACKQVLNDGLKKAGISMKDIDLIAFSQGPGIGNTLEVGAVAARTLSITYGIPIIGVNHCVAHLEVGNLCTDAKDPVLLYCSGANTQVIAFEGGRYRVFGETLDIGIGNFLDSVAREMGLGFPGGPKIYELSLKSKNYIELPYVVKGMDVSFGGIFTNVKSKLQKHSKEDLAYSIQETVFAMMLEVAERAMAHCNKSKLLLGGGVACNKRFQEMAHKMCKQREGTCFIPPSEFLLDNGGMIAWLGYIVAKAGNKMNIEDTSIRPYERTDDIDVNWR